jgi:hypothetical protein
MASPGVTEVHAVPRGRRRPVALVTDAGLPPS